MQKCAALLLKDLRFLEIIKMSSHVRLVGVPLDFQGNISSSHEEDNGISLLSPQKSSRPPKLSTQSANPDLRKPTSNSEVNIGLVLPGNQLVHPEKRKNPKQISSDSAKRMPDTNETIASSTFSAEQIKLLKDMSDIFSSQNQEQKTTTEAVEKLNAQLQQKTAKVASLEARVAELEKEKNYLMQDGSRKSEAIQQLTTEKHLIAQELSNAVNDLNQQIERDRQRSQQVQKSQLENQQLRAIITQQQAQLSMQQMAMQTFVRVANMPVLPIQQQAFQQQPLDVLQPLLPQLTMLNVEQNPQFGIHYSITPQNIAAPQIEELNFQ